MSIFFLRTILLYFIIVFSLRVMGKRHLGELQPSEFVVAIMISNIATLPIEDTNIPLIAGIVPILTLVCAEVLISFFCRQSKKMRQLVSGNPIVLIRDGVIDQRQMKELRYSTDDLLEQLRSKDVFDVADVAYAIVETTGQLSVFPKFEARAVTTEMMNLTPPPCANSPQLVLICDGELSAEGLASCNLRPEWLSATLQKNNVALQDVFLMTCNQAANYHLVRKSEPKKEKRRGAFFR